MTKAHKTPGAIIEFTEKMYRPPYAPFYDAHKGVAFEVKDPNKYPGHMLIKSLRDGTTIIIHDDEVQTVTKERLKELGLTPPVGV
jgi:hypothetical protein